MVGVSCFPLGLLLLAVLWFVNSVVLLFFLFVLCFAYWLVILVGACVV